MIVLLICFFLIATAIGSRVAMALFRPAAADQA
jgi:hypothetical protein